MFLINVSLGDAAGEGILNPERQKEENKFSCGARGDKYE